jgi:UDP-N-acetylglucosamine 1-carboxyvinyltransferase
MFQIFDELGVKYKRVEKTVIINSGEIKKSSIPDDLAIKLRASILLAGPLLSRVGKVSFHFPGGDVIGRRTITPHLKGFKSLGFSIKENDLKFDLSGVAKSADIFLEEASVMATENLVLASVLGNSKIKIRNCASEPHVQDLCNLLLNMGAKIAGIGTDTLIITGVPKLNGAKFKIGCDYIEVATYAIAAAITKGEIKIKSEVCDLDPIMVELNKFGVKISVEKNGYLVKPNDISSASKVITNIWPGFPTDLMSVVIVLATQAKGMTLCHDWMYESRMFFVDKLISMGANIVVADPHRVLVYGPTKLHSRVVDTPDIRAGMALVLAALVAEGETTINNVELIGRGYEDVAKKLRSLGASIMVYN